MYSQQIMKNLYWFNLYICTDCIEVQKNVRDENNYIIKICPRDKTRT